MIKTLKHAGPEIGANGKWRNRYARQNGKIGKMVKRQGGRVGKMVKTVKPERPGIGTGGKIVKLTSAQRLNR